MAKIKLSSVNVVEYCSDEIQSIRSFTETPQGNKEAEKLFIRLVKENAGKDAKYWTEEDYENLLDEGQYTDMMGYSVSLVHSI